MSLRLLGGPAPSLRAATSRRDAATPASSPDRCSIGSICTSCCRPCRWNDLEGAAAEDSAAVRARVATARGRAREPPAGSGRLPQRGPDSGGAGPLRAARRRGSAAGTQGGRALGLSVRALHRALRVARTIADLAGSEPGPRAAPGRGGRLSPASGTLPIGPVLTGWRAVRSIPVTRRSTPSAGRQVHHPKAYGAKRVRFGGEEERAGEVQHDHLRPPRPGPLPQIHGLLPLPLAGAAAAGILLICAVGFGWAYFARDRPAGPAVPPRPGRERAPALDDHGQLSQRLDGAQPSARGFREPDPQASRSSPGSPAAGGRAATGGPLGSRAAPRSLARSPPLLATRRARVPVRDRRERDRLHSHRRARSRALELELRRPVGSLHGRARVPLRVSTSRPQRREPVLATADGTVVSSGWSGDYGKLVEIAHRDRLSNGLRPPRCRPRPGGTAGQARRPRGARRLDRPLDRPPPPLRGSCRRPSGQSARVHPRRAAERRTSASSPLRPRPSGRSLPPPSSAEF